MTTQAVVVVGAGQAGLAVSCRLTEADVPHVVLEKGRVGETWRRRWDSFCLVTPNWTVQLPGYPYDGEEPGGFMARDEVVAYLERYAAASSAPVREGVEVSSLRRDRDGAFLLETTGGPLHAATVVLTTGYLDGTVSALPSPEARLFGNVLLTSHGGGHDLHLRTLQRLGVTLVGHFLGADGQRARFARDLGASTIAPGLYFAGVHFLRKRKSSLLVGVGEDAAIVAGQIATTARAA